MNAFLRFFSLFVLGLPLGLVSAASRFEPKSRASEATVEAAANKLGCKNPILEKAILANFFSDQALIFGCRVGKGVHIFVADAKSECAPSFEVKGFNHAWIVQPGSTEHNEMRYRDFQMGPGKQYQGKDSHLSVTEPAIQVCHNANCTMVEDWICHKKKWISEDRC